MSEATESEKYVSVVEKYLEGNGVDVGCGAKPVVPWAIAMDLPPRDYGEYHSGMDPARAIQFGGDARDLPFRNQVLDFVFSSHLIEDFLDWRPLLFEWVRVLKRGGYLVILVPDKTLWAEAIAKGQPPNCAHKHESRVGELSEWASTLGIHVIEDRLTNLFPGDYTILFVGQKI